MTAATAIVAVAIGAGINDLLDAMTQVESGGDVNAVGDQGRSIGPLQIQRGYWRDARVPGRYEQVRTPAYARRVVVAYWHRYCADALRRGDFETLARVHNGGPAGARKAATKPYWDRTRKQMIRPSR